MRMDAEQLARWRNMSELHNKTWQKNKDDTVADTDDKKTFERVINGEPRNNREP